MLDLKLIRSSPNLVEKSLLKRDYKFDRTRWKKLENRRKKIQLETEDLQSELNEISKEIGLLKKEEKDCRKEEIDAKKISKSIKEKSGSLNSLLSEINTFLLDIPNIPDDDVPLGNSDKDNLEIRTWGEKTKFNFEPQDHLSLGESLSGIDLESSAKISGARFSVLRNEFARLHRALINFMLDVHINEHGYQEVYVPYIVNADSLEGTGQLPKFEEELFKLDTEQPFYLAPTAEVPVTNLLRDEIIESKELPIKWVCHTPCFRSEAGNYGKDTKGIMRLHQFEKVELVQVVESSDSEDALEEITSHAEKILKYLNIPYRVVSLCSGDLGFAASKTYDIEVWVPSQKAYREISSCSNFRDFQTRRIKARWRNPHSKKIELLNTLNGSGLAVGRTLLALVENFQTEKGEIIVPEILKDYFKSKKITFS